MPTWSWIAIGLVLLVAEIAIPSGFFIFFFGLGALLVGVLAAVGLVSSITTELVLFSVFSVLSLVLFRKKVQSFLPPKHAGDDTDTLVGTNGKATETIPPGAKGKIELRGSSWTAKNVTDTPIESGSSVTVTAVDGLTLSVKHV